MAALKPVRRLWKPARMRAPARGSGLTRSMVSATETIVRGANATLATRGAEVVVSTRVGSPDGPLFSYSISGVEQAPDESRGWADFEQQRAVLQDADGGWTLHEPDRVMIGDTASGPWQELTPPRSGLGIAHPLSLLITLSAIGRHGVDLAQISSSREGSYDFHVPAAVLRALQPLLLVLPSESEYRLAHVRLDADTRIVDAAWAFLPEPPRRLGSRRKEPPPAYWHRTQLVQLGVQPDPARPETTAPDT